MKRFPGMRCEFKSCQREVVQFLQTWADTLVCRCEVHSIPFLNMRRDIKEIDLQQAQVLDVHSK
jgi:hypothetical protein